MDRDALLAVVIPVYRQGQYLADAVLSATRQTVAPIRIVVVDDGCPTDLTQREARWTADAFRETVTYLRTRNLGVAHARNFGARFALAAWPSVRAVCFLDADDRLSSHSLDALWKALAGSPTSVGWAYANLEYFGDRLGAWNIPRPFSRFRELFENQSGMGCLVHRRVFDGGLYFEGGTEASYEDWEFFIRATQLGFSGVHAGSVGVRYRIRENSRLAECQANYNELYDRMSRRNRDAFDPRERTRVEHDEMPRFALVSLQDERAWLFTDPLAPRRASIPLDELARRYSDYLAQYPDSTTYITPIVLLADEAAREWLWSSPLAPGLLLRIQYALRTCPMVTISDTGATPNLIAATFWEVIEGSPQLAELRAALDPVSGFTRPESPYPDYEQTHSEFALRLALSDQTTFPSTRATGRRTARDVFFVVARIAAADDDWCRALRRALGVAELTPDVRLHLVVTEPSRENVEEAALAPFATVTSLASISGPEQEEALLVMLGSADVVIDAGTSAVRSILGRPRRAEARYAATVHRRDVVDGRLPPYALTADHLVVGSDRLRRTCINLGASPDTVVLVPDRANVCPENLDDAEQIAREKSTPRSASDPVRLLFVGELDDDAGFDRLAPIGTDLEQRGLAFELRVVDGSCTDTARFVDEYRWADVLVQPSRRDGSPIRMLEAMAFGCVVVTTDVGEVPDVIEHARNGLLVASDVEEPELVRSFADRIQAAAVDSTGLRRVRHAAVATAMGRSWAESGAALLTALGASRG